MLAYIPDYGVAYNIYLTGLSLLLAIAMTGAGLTLAFKKDFAPGPALGGIVLGIGIGVMHYTGMSAVEVAGRPTWSTGMVMTSVAFGLVFAGLAI